MGVREIVQYQSLEIRLVGRVRLLDTDEHK